MDKILLRAYLFAQLLFGSSFSYVTSGKRLNVSVTLGTVPVHLPANQITSVITKLVLGVPETFQVGDIIVTVTEA